MTRRKLERLRKEVEGLTAKSGLRRDELERLVIRCGRSKVKRGKEMIYASPQPGSKFISIPKHPTISKGTARSILFALLDDIDHMLETAPADEPDQLEDKSKENDK